MQRLRSRLREERGVVLVEFAIVVPVLLLLLLGIIDFGRFLNYSEQQQQMAAQAARWAAVDGVSGVSNLQSYVATQALGGLESTGGDVTSAARVFIYYPSGSSNSVGNPIRACVVSRVQLLPLLGGTNLNLVQTATMRVETQGTPDRLTPDTAAAASAAGCPTA
jgi:Flp pilus assembly protein TadG